jgi:hypothetical protein
MTMTNAVLKKQPASFGFARELFQRGTDCFDSGTVSEVLGINLPTPPVQPFSEEELAQAKSLGHQLIWFPSTDTERKTITMKRLYKKSENKAPLGGKLLYDIGWWYKNETFFTEATVRTGKSKLGRWRLVGQTSIPGTKGVNYMEQTIIGTKYVSEVIYGGNPPEHLKAVLNEPDEREVEITKLMDENWQKAAEILANLQFNQQFRETPVEALIQIILNQKVNKVRLLENEYSWTQSRSRDGDLVNLGNADSDGACLHSWHPKYANVSIGFFLSRSEFVGSEL